ncbi:MBL fold metallo-hydrolase [Cellulomonas cellasea]|uniref:Glyoxylase-like metal-dependent hydrolase (Beta-lactamase superfamily II) n=1 Tax=Cellulomonas cellasea TaxID=43670 RepID=A0A7W4UCX2_9CELL|nr:MBL fold metallo-hydrolase [Cellulomonas cellasea]MBB2921839.1 glyoxylase-like metal-dependent hydrolase (beta-lactamase superfamily II) [Cellulomonas cellasea]
MQILTVVAPVFGTNCYVVVADDGTCVVVDAGAGVAGPVRDAVTGRGLRCVAVLATHGHVDHTWDAAELSEAFDVPVYVHAADAYRLDDPFGTLGLGASHDPGGPLAQALTAAGARPESYRRPERVETFGGAAGEGGRSADVVLALGGVRVVARHAPGHTQGSTLYLLGAAPEAVDGAPAARAGNAGTARAAAGAGGAGSAAAGGGDLVALTGDVLFAGTIGRTDLPGGDGAVMAATLRDVVAALPPHTVVLPGHGPSSRVATELVGNPYLAR